MSFNDADNLKNAYKILGEQFTDNELQDELDRAHRKLDTNVGHTFEEVKRADVNDQEDFSLSFSEVQTFTSARFLEEESKIDSSNYTSPTDTNGTDGVVTFDTTFADDNISAGTSIRFKYVPTRYEDLELWYAVLGLARRNTLQTREGSSSIDVEEAKEAVNDLESGINAKAGNRLVLDHRPRFNVHRSGV